MKSEISIAEELLKNLSEKYTNSRELAILKTKAEDILIYLKAYSGKIEPIKGAE